MMFLLRVLCLLSALISISHAQAPDHQVKRLKVTILSTMLADEGLGEWGFAALVEADGCQVLIDTGARPETVLSNARDLKIDLSSVRDVVITHFHPDHTGGLMTLRTEMKKQNPAALAQAHGATGIFYSRPMPGGAEGNPMIAIRPQYQASGGSFVEHAGPFELVPGVWLTGPIARKFPERNWGGSGKVRTPAGLVEDTVPDDQSVVVNTVDGLVVITGCGHAGIVNILTAVDSQFAHRPVQAVIGGLHLYSAKDEQVDWTGDRMKAFGVRYLMGAHCTGIESLYRLRARLGLTRQTAVVGAVGAYFTSTEGIHPGLVAQ
uniref:Beta-lactamase domain protein n=1 Tax=Solibacter usitatus (strain Ellin6076) TaxID=234267 RepID=Q021B4_SOLUE